MANKKEKTKEPKLSKEDQYEYLLSMVDVINESIKNMHERIDVCSKRIDNVSDLALRNSEIENKEMAKMVDRIAKRMGLK